jgi:hypothetical protein
VQLPLLLPLVMQMLLQHLLSVVVRCLTMACLESPLFPSPARGSISSLSGGPAMTPPAGVLLLPV